MSKVAKWFRQSWPSSPSSTDYVRETFSFATEGRSETDAPVFAIPAYSLLHFAPGRVSFPFRVGGAAILQDSQTTELFPTYLQICQLTLYTEELTKLQSGAAHP
jgi:hypothetical protein